MSSAPSRRRTGRRRWPWRRSGATARRRHPSPRGPAATGRRSARRFRLGAQSRSGRAARPATGRHTVRRSWRGSRWGRGPCAPHRRRSRRRECRRPPRPRPFRPRSAPSRSAGPAWSRVPRADSPPEARRFGRCCGTVHRTGRCSRSPGLRPVRARFRCARSARCNRPPSIALGWMSRYQPRSGCDLPIGVRTASAM